MPIIKRHGLQALQIWCQRATDSYDNVNIVDMTSSFKNGLAFCAIIHHYRPDLIDYENLKPENIYDNNALAFKVAEEVLDIPSLLDPEDMVEFEQPDKFSIVTYVSQFYHFFKSQDSSPVCSPKPRSIRNSESSETYSNSSAESTPAGTPKIGRIPSGFLSDRIRTPQKSNNNNNKTFNHADLLAKYGEEIFEKSSTKNSSKFEVKSLCSDMMVKATISEERES